MRLAIASVPVSDQLRSKAFYQDILGCSVLREAEMGGDLTWLQMMPPEGEAGIALVTWFDKMPPGSLQGLVLECANIDDRHALLKHRGLEISDIEDAFWGRFATFSDPDGNGWVLTQPAPEHT